MIQLTKDIIAVEVPNDAFGILLIHGNTRLAYFHPNYKRIDLDCRAESLIGVTPLSEEQWKEVVYGMEIQERDLKLNPIGESISEYLDYDYRNNFGVPMLKTATESGLSLLESKGLDVNKKYAIIKIEK